MQFLNRLLAFIVLSTGCSLQPSDQPAKPPNIIFILTDDQRWDALGYAGNTILETPAMDRLATEGTYFKKAFVTTPICAASRASILTGLHERTHGYTFQQGDLKAPYMRISYPVKLREGGYYTGFFGKFGVNYNDAENLFDVAEIYDRNNQEPNRKGYFYKTIGDETVHLTRYTGHQAQEFIRQAPRDRPFCLSLSFSAPHAHDSAPEQYIWQEKSNQRYEQVTIPPPPLSEARHFEVLPREVREGFNRTRWFWRFDTPEKYQHSVKGYYRMISEIDDELASIRELLSSMGLADNTVIILMGDNGYYLGERQLAGKWLMHDNSLRVPLILFDPRAGIHHDVEALVLNLDVPQTILHLAGIETPPEYQGQSLVPYVRNRNHPSARTEILVEHLWDFPEIPSSEGIRTARWKYFRYRLIEAPEELYDLETDSAETVNLAMKPEHQPLVKQLRRELDARIRSYTDAAFAPGGPDRATEARSF
ncbi:MAG: sulfatase [Acidobacteriota bacterium]|nr:MAG: sulfatase [Acidobacteriota bacterium]